MKKLKFSKKVDKYCKNCRFGSYFEFSDQVFCIKKGIVDKFNKCAHFKYDPLKRVPDTVSSLPQEFKKEDFML